jgi:hypothetical protein
MNRDAYHPSILIISNDRDMLEEWWRSLRYSTHVSIYFLTTLHKLNFHSFNLKIYHDKRADESLRDHIKSKNNID